MPYNQLWCLAFVFAAASGMTSHRTTQFANDYAQVFEGASAEDTIDPAGFSDWASRNDFHYHDRR